MDWIIYDLRRFSDPDVLPELEKYARLRRVGAVEIISETGESKHPQLRRLLRRRSNARLLVYSISRLPDSIRSLLVLADAVERGVFERVIFVRERLTLNREARRSPTLRVVLALRNAERESRLRKSKIALQIARLLGGRPHRPKKITDAVEREILRLRKAGIPISAIAREISQTMVKISRSSVQDVLRRQRTPIAPSNL